MSSDNFKWNDWLSLAFAKEYSSSRISIDMFKASHSSGIVDENTFAVGTVVKDSWCENVYYEKMADGRWKRGNNSPYFTIKDSEIGKGKRFQPIPQRAKLSDTRRIEFLEERIAYIEKKLSIDG